MDDKHTIEKYLIPTCLIIIDEFNHECEGIRTQSPALAKFSNRFSETGLVFRIGYPFGHRAEYSTPANKGDKKGFNDIEIKSNDFRIEVKFLKQHKSNTGNTRSGKMTWESIKKDFDWLQDEIEKGNKGKCAFIIGWYNSAERFSQLVQMGVQRTKPARGEKSEFTISKDKEVYFPFVGYDPITRLVQSVFYIYEKTFETLELPIQLKGDSKMHWVFLGRPDDKFHFALYF